MVHKWCRGRTHGGRTSSLWSGSCFQVIGLLPVRRASARLARPKQRKKKKKKKERNLGFIRAYPVFCLDHTQQTTSRTKILRGVLTPENPCMWCARPCSHKELTPPLYGVESLSNFLLTHAYPSCSSKSCKRIGLVPGLSSLFTSITAHTLQKSRNHVTELIQVQGIIWQY